MKINKIKENGLYAIYCNKEYELIIRENKYLLFSTDNEDFEKTDLLFMKMLQAI